MRSSRRAIADSLSRRTSPWSAIARAIKSASSCAEHDHGSQYHQDREPTPLDSPDIVLGTLALCDEAFTLGQSFAFLICESRRSLFARRQK